MLSQVFHAQWNNEIKGDWTVQVKSDLDDFGIPWDLDFIKLKSKDSFKRLVKVKTLEFALDELNSDKAKHSKFNNLIYSILELQNYSESSNINPDDAQQIFSYRSRMANFNENFRGGAGPKMCTLCSAHTDSQEMAFQCPKTTPHLKAKGVYGNIFGRKLLIETSE